MARAIWKGRLVIGDDEVAVKLYSAVQDRTVHFRLLHAKDREPVEQRIVRKSDGKEVAKDQRRKAYPLDAQTMVLMQPEDLDALRPPDSRDIDLCRFVPTAAVNDQWYDRPYFLGPDDDESSYFALAKALQASGRVGIARWVMRNARYVGALRAIGGYLLLITLRRSDQVLSVSGIDIPASRKADPKELKLAGQLISSIEGDFAPQEWPHEHHRRLCELIAAKARGEKVKVVRPKFKRAGGDLADQLQRSLAQAKERKVA